MIYCELGIWWVKWLKIRARFYHSCDYLCTLYFLVKIRKVKLKNLPASACFNLNSGTTKQKYKSVKIAKMVQFIETCERINRFYFLTPKCLLNNLTTMNLKYFCNHGGIYRFEKKLKKFSEETKTL